MAGSVFEPFLFPGVFETNYGKVMRKICRRVHKDKHTCCYMIKYKDARPNKKKRQKTDQNSSHEILF